MTTCVCCFADIWSMLMILCGDILCLLMKESVTKSSDRLRLACWLGQRHTSSARFNFYPTAQHHFFLVSFPSPKRSDGVCVGLIGDGGVGGEGFVDKGEREREKDNCIHEGETKREKYVYEAERKRNAYMGGGGGDVYMSEREKEKKNVYMKERRKKYVHEGERKIF